MESKAQDQIEGGVREREELLGKIDTLEAKLAKAARYVKQLRDLTIDLWENDAGEKHWFVVDYYHDLIDETETLAQLSEKGEGNDSKRKRL